MFDTIGDTARVPYWLHTRSTGCPAVFSQTDPLADGHANVDPERHAYAFADQHGFADALGLTAIY